MGKWRKTPNEAFLGYESELWDRYPRHVVRAFFSVSYDDILLAQEEKSDIYNEDEVAAQAIEFFTQRRGGISDETFVRVLEQADDRDRLVAIFAIGHSSLPNAVNLLTPFLSHPDLLVRSAAAIMLGFRYDERSLPVLEEYLLADEPTMEIQHPETNVKIRKIWPEAQIWFGRYRPYIAGILAGFGPASMTAVLRKSFFKHWQQAQGTLPDYFFLDSLLYALGQRGAFASLHGIALPEVYRRLAMIYLALGALRADERFDNMDHEMIVNKEMKQEVVTICTTQFGLTEEEVDQCIGSFASDHIKRRIS